MNKYPQTRTRSALLVSDEPEEFALFDHALALTYPEVDFIHCTITTALKEGSYIKPDLVFFRVRPNSTDSYDSLEAIIKVFSPIKVIVFTNLEPSATASKAYDSEAVLFLPKPHDADQLAELLKTTLSTVW